MSRDGGGAGAGAGVRVDTLHLSARGVLRPELWDELEAAREQAQADEESVPVELDRTGQAFNVKGHGLRGYSVWLSSPDYELLLGKSQRFPAALVQVHSAYLHSIGIASAVRLIEQTLGQGVFAGSFELAVSRVDLYADVEGWHLELDDLRRFVCSGRFRRTFADDEKHGAEVYTYGRRVTGFVFGRGDLLCRIYDKTTEIKRRGVSWLPDLWGELRGEETVWRVEFQLRRPVLVDFGLRTVDEAQAGLQDLWRYVTGSWLTYRRPVADKRVRRWPIDPVWEVVQAVRLSPEQLGVVRRRLLEANEERLVQGLQGYLSGLAALRGWRDLSVALRRAEGLVEGYLHARGRTWTAEVQRKQERLMSVTSWLDEAA